MQNTFTKNNSYNKYTKNKPYLPFVIQLGNNLKIPPCTLTRLPTYPKRLIKLRMESQIVRDMECKTIQHLLEHLTAHRFQTDDLLQKHQSTSVYHTTPTLLLLLIVPVENVMKKIYKKFQIGKPQQLSQLISNKHFHFNINNSILS